jgi:colanic acid/amylovoran biosynthesis glycosyltransferase
MKNIAYIISMPHGIDRWTFREIDGLRPRGVNISLFPLRYATGPYMPRSSWRCYRFQRWQVIAQQVMALIQMRGSYLALVREALQTHTLVDLMLAIAFSQQMKHWNVEHIHCVFGDHKLFVGYYCKKLLNIPLSVAIYGYELKANPNWAMFQKALVACDEVITNCDYNGKLVEQYGGNHVTNKLHVIRHYADVLPPLPRNLFKILIVGGFSERKGHDVLFKAIRALGDQSHCLEVWVVGYAGTVDVAALAHQLGVEAHVRIFGAVSDEMVDFLYQQCDLFCLPSRTDQDGISEGLPVSLIEAMACGKPVISTRMAGIPELVDSVLVTENDPDALAAAIQRYMDDPVLCERDGKRNQEIVSARYSTPNLDAMARLLLEEGSS